MPIATIDGIATRYEVLGHGPPLLMFSPGGFDATLDKWSTLGVYARIKLLEHLPERYTCIVFDRRETGRSGGRVETITWNHYVAQGAGLLDHLGHETAHLLGGCMGCCPVVAFAVHCPRRVASMILYWPVGGAEFRRRGEERFATHLDFVASAGLKGVVELARSTDAGFGKDPRLGPWAQVLRSDPRFATDYARRDPHEYAGLVSAMLAALIDRDTAPGAEPEELRRLEIPTLIVPGDDPVHATSAARYLAECLPRGEYWDLPPEQQTEANVPDRLLAFLDAAAPAD
ncbi:MAG TPA: alpha/beta hydrolase [Gammaproteobacteria bacterium]|nr:alpha/beta hydrolase [Gammaproteobacteria bacterium]